MILRSENSIYLFYEVIEQIEPETILDVGMFLKRTGAVSRKIMSREVPECAELTGIDFFPEINFPVWHMIYDCIVDAGQYFKTEDDKTYDLTVLLGLRELKEKIPFEQIVERISESSRYILSDEWDPLWSTTEGFLDVVDIKMDADIFYLLKFEE